MSALAEKLAPIAGASKLYMQAVDAVRRNMPAGVNDAMAVRFADRLAMQEPLLAELVGREHLHVAAFVYLDRVAADMRGDVWEEAKRRVQHGQTGVAFSQPHSSSASWMLSKDQLPFISPEHPAPVGERANVHAPKGRESFARSEHTPEAA